MRRAMANERLRSAMAKAQADVEAITQATGVDPKTVQRWLTGRVPHPRHRFLIADQLGENEEAIWPGARRTQPGGASAAAEIVAAYPFRADVDTGRWWSLIDGA